MFFFFWLKTAYDICACVVGSEMRMRDGSSRLRRTQQVANAMPKQHAVSRPLRAEKGGDDSEVAEP